MRRSLHVVLVDLRRGRNGDVYLAVAAAAVVGVLGLVGALHLRWIAPVLLLCMVPLLNLVLALNDKFRAIGTAASAPLLEFPADELRRDWGRTDDVLLVGVTLIRTVRNYESDLARRIEAGRRVRVLVVDPADRAAMEWTDRRRQFGAPDPAGNAHEVGITLSALRRLGALGQGGELEVRAIRFPIGLGGYLFGGDQPDARLYAETYPFRTPETHPHFALSPDDGHWFRHFKSELTNMWDAARTISADS